MQVPSRALSTHGAVTALLCLPPVVGLAVLMVPGNEILGGLLLLSWPVSVIYLAVVRRWSAASWASAAMAALSLAGLGWVYLKWTWTGCMYGLVLVGAVFVLGGSAGVASLLGLLCCAVGGRRQRTRQLRIATVTNGCLLVVALVAVAVLLADWHR